MRLRNRDEAGRLLAERLARYAQRPEVIVRALPRGGVPVAAALADRLRVELDIVLVRKLGVPGHEEYAMGAIASGGMRWLNDEVVGALGIGAAAIEAITLRESEELERRSVVYRGAAPAPDVSGRIVILVDDGLATGATMRVAARAVRVQRPQRLIIAVPVGAHESCEDLRDEADEMLCLDTPEPFRAVGLWYDDFRQTTDEEVIDLLRAARRRASGASA